MVDFACAHCGAAFSVADDLTGRQGWCRSCKRLIVVPAPDGAGGVSDLSIEERCDRLDRLAQYAAAKADRYRLLLYQMRQEAEKLSLRAKAGDEQALRAQAAEQRLSEAQGAMEGLLRELERNTAAREQLHEQNEELHRRSAQALAELADERSERSAAEKRLSDARRLRREDRRRHEEELSALRERAEQLESVAADNGEWEAVLRERDHLRGALEAAQEQRRDAELRFAESEAGRKRLEEGIEERRRQEEAADGGTETLRTRIEELQKGRAEAEAAWEASERQREQAEETAAGLRRELDGLRDVLKQNKTLHAAHDEAVDRLREHEESLAAAERRTAETAERLQEAKQTVHALQDEVGRLRVELRVAEQARLRAVEQAEENAARSAMMDLAGIAGDIQESPAEDDGSGGEDHSEVFPGSGEGLSDWPKRPATVNLTPLDDASGGGDGLILTPELLGGDPLMDDFMRFLAPEADAGEDEMSGLL